MPEKEETVPKPPDLKLHLELLPISQLQPFDGNPRVAKDDLIDRLEDSIRYFGFVNPVLAYKRPDGKIEIIAGHQRVKAARDAGLQKLPVILLPFDEAKARAYNITDNRTAELSDWDFPKLKNLLEDLDTGAFDIDVTGFKEPERESLMTWVRPDTQKTRQELDDAEKKFGAEYGSSSMVYKVIYFRVDDQERFLELCKYFSPKNNREGDPAKLWKAYEVLNGKKEPEVPDLT